jgi:hypothetical protein
MMEVSIPIHIICTVMGTSFNHGGPTSSSIRTYSIDNHACLLHEFSDGCFGGEVESVYSAYVKVIK